jgi:ribosomal protein L7/L12
MKPTRPALPDAAIAALRDGHVIDAIKLVREQTGLGLAEAKAAIDAYLSGASVHRVAGQGASIPLSAIAMLEAGNLIGAIKATRAGTGLGLKDAKLTVEQHLEAHPAIRERFKAAAAIKRSELVRIAIAIGAILVALYVGMALRN